DRKRYSHTSSQFCFEWRGHAASFPNVPVQWTVRRNRHRAEAAFEHTNTDLTASGLPTPREGGLSQTWRWCAQRKSLAQRKRALRDRNRRPAGAREQSWNLVVADGREPVTGLCARQRIEALKIVERLAPVVQHLKTDHHPKSVSWAVHGWRES